jgi:hypothetical protein
MKKFFFQKFAKNAKNVGNIFFRNSLKIIKNEEKIFSKICWKSWKMKKIFFGKFAKNAKNTKNVGNIFFKIR